MLRKLLAGDMTFLIGLAGVSSLFARHAPLFLCAYDGHCCGPGVQRGLMVFAGSNVAHRQAS